MNIDPDKIIIVGNRRKIPLLGQVLWNLWKWIWAFVYAVGKVVTIFAMLCVGNYMEAKHAMIHFWEV